MLITTYLPKIVKHTRCQEKQQIERYHYRGRDFNAIDPTRNHHAVRGAANCCCSRAEATEAKIEQPKFRMQHKIYHDRK